jgi:hypothetical protein
MKYQQKSFSVHVGNEKYRDGWDAIFGKKEEEVSTQDAARRRVVEYLGDAADVTPEDEHAILADWNLVCNRPGCEFCENLSKTEGA